MHEHRLQRTSSHGWSLQRLTQFDGRHRACALPTDIPRAASCLFMCHMTARFVQHDMHAEFWPSPPMQAAAVSIAYHVPDNSHGVIAAVHQWLNRQAQRGATHHRGVYGWGGAHHQVCF